MGRPAITDQMEVRLRLAPIFTVMEAVVDRQTCRPVQAEAERVVLRRQVVRQAGLLRSRPMG